MIIDQYKQKYDGKQRIKELEEMTEKMELFKFICCSSNNEEDIRENIFKILFDDENKIIHKKKYKIIHNLVDDCITKLEDRKKILYENFGCLPIYFTKISNCNEINLRQIREELMNVICEKVKHSLNKLNLGEFKLLALLRIIEFQNKIIDKKKLKELFHFIIYKFIYIIPLSNENNYNENIIIDYSKKYDKFKIKYSFPIIKIVFEKLIKEYKQVHYNQTLIFANDAEEGYILEHLIYSSLDTAQTVFKENYNIKYSYKIDQLFQCTKLYIDSENYFFETDKDIKKIDEQEFIDSLFEAGQAYHFSQKNTNGKKFDGAILIPLRRKNIENKNNVIQIKEEKIENSGKEIKIISGEENNSEIQTSQTFLEDSKNNELKKRNRKKTKKFSMIAYQATKKKRSKLSNAEIVKYKNMLIENIETVFDIEIENFSFFYILEYENQDHALIKFCEQINNQLSYIFYSLNEHKFVSSKGAEISILDYVHKKIKPLDKILECFPKYNEQNEKELYNFLYTVPENFEYKKDSQFFLRKKRNNEFKINKKEYKFSSNNFIYIFEDNEREDQIFFNEDPKTYNDNKDSKKKLFFEKYYSILKNDNEQQNNIGLINNKIETKEKDDIIIEIENYDFKIKEKKEENKLILKFFMEEIQIVENYISFSSTFIIELKTIFNKLIDVNNKKYDIYYHCIIDKKNIVPNLIKLPFFYVIKDKNVKNKYLLIKKDDKICQMYDLGVKKLLLDEDFYKFIVDLAINEKCLEKYIIILGSLYEY